MSPLGRYAALVSAITTTGIIGVYLAALVIGDARDPAALQDLHDLAILAFGAIVGSAVAVNGYKGPLSAVHKRLDKAGIPPADDATE